MEQTVLPIPPGVFWGLVAFAVLAVGVFAIIAFPPKTSGEDSAFKRVKADLGLTKLNPGLFLVLAIIWLLLAASLLIGLFWLLWETVLQAAPEDQAEVWDYRFSLAKLVALVGTLAAVVAFPFTLIRTHFNRRQTETEEEGLLTDRINAAVQSLGAQKEVRRHLTDDKDEHLYHEKEGTEEGELDYKRPVVETFTEPNIEVRIGAIYALERIAQKNSEEVHVQIMEILCAYVRENAPASSAAVGPNLLFSPDDLSWHDKFDSATGVIRTQTELWEILRKNNSEIVAEWRSKLPPVRSDILVALEVIQRRDNSLRNIEARHRNSDGAFPFNDPVPDYREGSDPVSYRDEVWKWREPLEKYKGYQPDLSQTNLQGADLAKFDLRGVNLSYARMQGASLHETNLLGTIFHGAEMHGAYLGWAQMQGAQLFRAQLQGAFLGWAKMCGATLEDANLRGSDLSQAQMQGVYLGWVQMQGADLNGVQMQGAFLGATQMQGARLSSANMQGVDLNYSEIDESTYLVRASFRGAAARSLDKATTEQLRPFWDEIFADGSVAPDNSERPSHWLKSELDFADFDERWRLWRASLPAVDSNKLLNN